jgi:hypothetical protein
MVVLRGDADAHEFVRGRISAARPYDLSGDIA